ncbi:MAG: hypothetical protein OXE94_14515 [Aestuariivita sp.]|nr:hypothetical protein [Aestuariivita sp.]MCY4202857.1 hypothetical protein [Aestuariivita sp.]
MHHSTVTRTLTGDETHEPVVRPKRIDRFTPMIAEHLAEHPEPSDISGL